MRFCRAAGEVHCGGIASTEQYSDALAERWLIAVGEECGEGRCTPGFGNDAQDFPERFLGLLYFRIGNQEHLRHVALRDREHELADAFRSQRVGGDSSGGTVYRAAGFEGIGQRGGGFRFDTDDFRAASIPGGHAAEEAATADGHQKNIQMRGLFFQFETDGALAEKRFDLIVGVDPKSARFRSPGFAGGQRIGIALTGDYQIRAIAANSFHLF